MTDPHSSPSQTGVILAAGLGSRLREGAVHGLKPLTPVGGRPLLIRGVDTLTAAGCDRVVIVVGYGAEEVEAAFARIYDGPAPVVFAHNPDFKLSNGVSLLAARPQVPGEFIVTMADHVFDETVTKVARDHVPPAGSVSLLVDRKLDTIFDMDDATKVATDGQDKIRTIGKTLETFDAVDTGMFVCSPTLFDVLQRIRDQRGDVSMSDAMTELAASGHARAVDVGPGIWQDVDTPKMLAQAERLIAAQPDNY